MPTSLFNRFVSRPRHPWRALGLVVLFLVVTPLIIGFASGSFDELFGTNLWRGILGASTVIVYILVIVPRMAHVDARVLESLRSIVLRDDATFNRIVHETADIKPRNEIIAFAIGGAVPLLLRMGYVSPFSRPMTLYADLLNVAMFGMLGWMSYAWVTSSRLVAALLRQPIVVDPLDTVPFEIIGRQSLLIALAFMGGITISFLYSTFEPAVLRQPEFWLTYGPIVMIPIIIFFLNMRPTHRVLAAARDQELRAVRGQIRQASNKLMKLLDASQDTQGLVQVVNALLVYERRLQEARTWPYNTGMLRALFVSVLVPLVTVVAKAAFERLAF